MEIISSSQCRAARALLDMKQAELAEQAGISSPALGRFESGESEPRPSTLRALRDVLERAGIDFLDDDGIKRRTDTILSLKGKDANRRMLDDIYQTLRHSGGEVLISGLRELTPAAGDDFAFLEYHLERLQEAGITERILVGEGDTNLVAPAHWYRQIPADYFSPATFQLYGNKLALIAWGEEQQVLIIENRLFAEAFRKQFNFAWDNAKRVES